MMSAFSPLYSLRLLLVALVVSGLLLAAAFWLPLATEEDVIISLEKASTAFSLESGMALRQRIVAPPGLFSGVVVYADAAYFGGRQLEVVVSDDGGHIFGTGRRVVSSYLPADDTLRLAIPTEWFRLQQPQHLLVTVRLVRGEALPVYVSSGEFDAYGSGELAVEEWDIGRDMAISLTRRTQLSFGARQGVIAGIALLCGLVGVQALPRRWQWWGVALLVFTVTPLVLGGYWFSSGDLGIADWDYYFSVHHVYRLTLLQYHQFPFWNPYTCGGTAGLADPEFPVLGPQFLLELLFGIPSGLRLVIYTSSAVGAIGFILLAFRLGLSPQAALLVALGAMFSSVNFLEVTEGHVDIFSAAWIPWIFWAWLGAYTLRTVNYERTTACWSLVCGVFLALTFLQGGVYLLLYTGFAFLFLLLFVSRKRHAVVVTVRAILWALGLSAVKLVPVLFWLKQFPDEAYASSTYTLPWLIDILFGRHLHGTYLIFRQGGGWHEYGAYIGYGILALALVGLARLRHNRVVLLLFLGAVLALVLSGAGPFLKPIFDTLPYAPRSNISRIILFAVISISLLAGYGLDWLQRRWRLIPSVLIVVVGLIAIDLFSLTYQLSEQAFVLPHVYPIVPPAPSPITFTQNRFDSGGAGTRMTREYDATVAGWGTLAYCSVLGPHPAAKVISDENHEIVEFFGSTGAFDLVHWSPNKVVVNVVTPSSGDVILNTNFADGWVVNGQEAYSIDGRVGTTVAAGRHVLEFRYVQPGFYFGLFISGVAISLATFLVGRRWWVRRGS